VNTRIIALVKYAFWAGRTRPESWEEWWDDTHLDLATEEYLQEILRLVAQNGELRMQLEDLEHEDE